MLTKKMRFSDDVLDVLRGMDWQDNGTLGVLRCGQLDRKLYTDVNKALEAMGGKWNRKLGGHSFPEDPREKVEGLLLGGILEVARDGFFETPAAVVEKMFELAPLPKLETNTYFVLEPSAGLGAIAKHLFGLNFTLIEKNHQRCEELRKVYKNVLEMDFLDFWQDGIFMRIYMNPPFEDGQDIDHVMHAYQILAAGGKMVSVMSEGSFFRSDKKSVAFREWLDSVGGLSERLPEGAFRESGTGVNTRLVVIGKD